MIYSTYLQILLLLLLTMQWVDHSNYQLKRTLFFLVVGGRHARSVSSQKQRQRNSIFHTLSDSEVKFCTSSSQIGGTAVQGEELTNQIVEVYITRDFSHKWREKTAGKIVCAPNRTKMCGDVLSKFLFVWKNLDVLILSYSERCYSAVYGDTI